MTVEGQAPEPGTEQWQEVDRAVLAFERAWRTAPPPAIEPFLPPAGPARAAVLRELVHVDLERRWKAGGEPRPEDYLERFPELRDDAPAAADLIAADFRFRRQRDPGCSPGEYLRRFPAYRKELLARLPAAPDAALPEPEGSPGRDGVNPTPVSLLERLRDPGDGRAWSLFAELYTPLLFAWARRAGLQEATAADLVQELFVVLVRELPRFRYEPGKSFRGWLRTVLLNKWREIQRRLPPVPAEAVLDALAAPEAEPPGANEDRLEFVRRALKVLKNDFRPATWEAFWQTAALGRPAAAVAAELDMTANAVQVAKFRVLKRLRSELEGLLG